MRCPPTCISCTLVLLLTSLQLSTASPAAAAKVAPASVAKPDILTLEAVNAPAEVKAEGASAPKDVDAGEPTKRKSRNTDAEYEDDEEDVNSAVPELIPIAETRNVRGNGKDDLIADENPEAAKDVVNSLINELEREARNEGLLDDGIQLDSNLEARSQQCLKDGEKCQENAGCCSLFCSWTRDFTCYTFTG